MAFKVDQDRMLSNTPLFIKSSVGEDAKVLDPEKARIPPGLEENGDFPETPVGISGRYI